MAYVSEDGTEYQPMDVERFWHINATVRAESSSNDDMVERLTAALAALPEADIVGYYSTFQTLDKQVNTADLQDAACVIMGSCSDDGFDYFRRWVIAQGQDVFDNALRDPETLGDVVAVGQMPVFERFTHAMYAAYEGKTGKHMPVVHDDQELLLVFDPDSLLVDAEDEEDATDAGKSSGERYKSPFQRFPKLAAKFQK